MYSVCIVNILRAFSFTVKWWFFSPMIMKRETLLMRLSQKSIPVYSQRFKWTSVIVFNGVSDIFCWCIAFLYSTFLWIELWTEIEFKPLSVCICIIIWMKAWRLNKAFCMEQDSLIITKADSGTLKITAINHFN